MWLDDSYVQDVVFRDQIAQAERHAARQRLLRLATPPRPPLRVGAVLRRLAEPVSIPRLKLLIERMVS